MLLLLMLCVISCDSEPSSSTTSEPSETVTSPAETTGESTTDTTAPAVKAPVRPDCELPGNVLEENQFWAKDENLIVAILAAPETNDPDFGESHRVLEVYDGSNCERVMREILPVNVSPDFPYYLSDITYNNLSRLIAIRGFDKVYIFDLEKRKLNGPIVPKFLNERYPEDAQSGMIQRLEVWEDYLIGYAQSMGSFVFDMRNSEEVAPVLPSAEYEIMEGTEYNSLFLLPSSDKANGHQAILPSFDFETEEFSINPLFEKPKKIETRINRNVRDNRYLVLKELLGGTDSRPIAIDMEKMVMYDLPEEVAEGKVSDIIEWMKNQ